MPGPLPPAALQVVSSRTGRAGRGQVSGQRLSASRGWMDGALFPSVPAGSPGTQMESKGNVPQSMGRVRILPPPCSGILPSRSSLSSPHALGFLVQSWNILMASQGNVPQAMDRVRRSLSPCSSRILHPKLCLLCFLFPPPRPHMLGSPVE